MGVVQWSLFILLEDRLFIEAVSSRSPAQKVTDQQTMLIRIMVQYLTSNFPYFLLKLVDERLLCYLNMMHIRDASRSI